MKLDKDYKRKHTDPSPPSSLCAYEAAQRFDGQDGLDFRPRVMDGNLKTLTLIDSGSQVTVIQPDPGDQVDPSISLESVGGDFLPCYGKK